MNIEHKLHHQLNGIPQLSNIGTPRVMHFRSKMFSANVNYNAGGIVSNISKFKELFLQRILG